MITKTPKSDQVSDKTNNPNNNPYVQGFPAPDGTKIPILSANSISAATKLKQLDFNYEKFIRGVKETSWDSQGKTAPEHKKKIKQAMDQFTAEREINLGQEIHKYTVIKDRVVVHAFSGNLYLYKIEETSIELERVYDHHHYQVSSLLFDEDMTVLFSCCPSTFLSLVHATSPEVIKYPEPVLGDTVSLKSECRLFFYDKHLRILALNAEIYEKDKVVNAYLFIRMDSQFNIKDFRKLKTYHGRDFTKEGAQIKLLTSGANQSAEFVLFEHKYLKTAMVYGISNEPNADFPRIFKKYKLYSPVAEIHKLILCRDFAIVDNNSKILFLKFVGKQYTLMIFERKEKNLKLLDASGEEDGSENQFSLTLSEHFALKMRKMEESGIDNDRGELRLSASSDGQKIVLYTKTCNSVHLIRKKPPGEPLPFSHDEINLKGDQTKINFTGDNNSLLAEDSERSKVLKIYSIKPNHLEAMMTVPKNLSDKIVRWDERNESYLMFEGLRSFKVEISKDQKHLITIFKRKREDLKEKENPESELMTEEQLVQRQMMEVDPEEEPDSAFYSKQEACDLVVMYWTLKNKHNPEKLFETVLEIHKKHTSSRFLTFNNVNFGFENPAAHIKFSKEADLMVIASVKHAHIWFLETKEGTQELKHCKEPINIAETINVLELLNQKKGFIAGCDDKQIKIFAFTMKSTETKHNCMLLQVLRGHTEIVTSCCLSTNQKILVTGDYNGSLLVWNKKRSTSTTQMIAEIGVRLLTFSSKKLGMFEESQIIKKALPSRIDSIFMLKRLLLVQGSNGEEGLVTKIFSRINGTTETRFTQIAEMQGETLSSFYTTNSDLFLMTQSFDNNVKIWIAYKNGIFPIVELGIYDDICVDQKFRIAYALEEWENQSSGEFKKSVLRIMQLQNPFEIELNYENLSQLLQLFESENNLIHIENLRKMNTALLERREELGLTENSAEEETELEKTIALSRSKATRMYVSRGTRMFQSRVKGPKTNQSRQDGEGGNLEEEEEVEEVEMDQEDLDCQFQEGGISPQDFNFKKKKTREFYFDKLVHSRINFLLLTVLARDHELLKEALEVYGYKPFFYRRGMDPFINAIEVNDTLTLSVVADYLKNNETALNFYMKHRKFVAAMSSNNEKLKKLMTEHFISPSLGVINGALKIEQFPLGDNESEVLTCNSFYIDKAFGDKLEESLILANKQRRQTVSVEFLITKIRLNFSIFYPTNLEILRCLRGLSDELITGDIKYVIRYIWRMNWFLILGFITFEWFTMTMFVLHSVWYPKDVYLAILTFICSTILFVFEILVMIRDWDFYWRQIPNFLDLYSYSMMMAISITNVATEAGNTLLGFENERVGINLWINVTILIAGFRTLGGLRIIEAVRYLIAMLRQVFVDMIGFTIILLSSIGFFSIVRLHLTTVRTFGFEPSWKQFRTAMDYYGAVAFGNWESTANYNIAEYVQFVMSSIFLAVIMINLVIGIISQTFADFQEKKDLVDIKEIVDILVEYAVLLSYIRRVKTIKMDNAGRTLVCIIKKKSDNQNSVVNRVVQRIDAVEDRINNRFEQVEQQMGLIQSQNEKILRMLRRQDRLR